MVRHRQFACAKRSDERGIALIIALLALLVLSVLAAAIIFVTQSQVLTSYNYKLVTQGRYAAETGAQNTINWLVYNYTPPTPAQVPSYTTTTNPVTYSSSPVILSAMSGVSSNYPDSAVQNAFNAALNNKAVTGLGVTATYSTYAKLKRMQSFTQAFSSTPGLLQTWEITSQGTLSTINPTLVQVVETFENTGTPIFNFAVFATANTCSSLTFESGGTTDSFDSSLGTYAATKQNSNGNLGTNGNLLNSSTLTINGSLSTPWSTPYSGGCPPMAASSGNPTTATGGFQSLTPPVFPTPTIPVTPNTGYSMPSVIPPGTYGNATGCSGTYHFSAGTYNFNSIDCDSGATFVVDSGPVILNVGGVGASGYALNFQSGLVINAGGKPSNFQIVYGGTAGLNMQSGAGPVNALIYAPNSNVNFQSSGDLYGAMVAKTVDFQSSGAIHYDRSLANNLMVQGSYHPVSFSWSKN